MGELLTPSQIEERYGHLPYITPYQKVIALVDDGLETVELHEFHARGRCAGGAAWEVFHYRRTSPLVVSARREGARNIFTCRVGVAQLQLEPGIASAGIEEITIDGNEVSVTYAGLAGGGVAASICRGMARGVSGTLIHEEGGGAGLGRATLKLPAKRKVVIGVDDTDDGERGATWSTVNEIAAGLEREGLASYLLHTIAQLYPYNPHRTTNCCATAASFGVSPSDREQLRVRFTGELSGRCYSDQCGMAVFERIEAPEELARFSGRAASMMVSEEDAQAAADANGVELVAVTGRRGCIGALAAVGVHCDPDSAVIPKVERE